MYATRDATPEKQLKNAACQARLIEYYLQHELNQYVLHTTIILSLPSLFSNLIWFQQPSFCNGHWLGKGRLYHTSDKKCAKQMPIENDQCASNAPSKTWTANCATAGHSNTKSNQTQTQRNLWHNFSKQFETHLNVFYALQNLFRVVGYMELMDPACLMPRIWCKH